MKRGEKLTGSLQPSLKKKIIRTMLMSVSMYRVVYPQSERINRIERESCPEPQYAFDIAGLDKPGRVEKSPAGVSFVPAKVMFKNITKTTNLRFRVTSLTRQAPNGSRLSTGKWHPCLSPYTLLDQRAF